MLTRVLVVLACLLGGGGAKSSETAAPKSIAKDAKQSLLGLVPPAGSPQASLRASSLF